MKRRLLIDMRYKPFVYLGILMPAYWYLLMGSVSWSLDEMLLVQDWIWKQHPFLTHIFLGFILFLVLPLLPIYKFLVIGLTPLLVRTIVFINFAMKETVDGEAIGWLIVISVLTATSGIVGAGISWIMLESYKKT